MNNEKTLEFYQNSYGFQGFSAQRLYPNEELLRFMGRNLFTIPFEKRNQIKILEVGCGSCSNLWMIAKEGFDTYGCDFSKESLLLGAEMLRLKGTTATLECQDMTNMNYESSSFDIIIDVFSSNCLPMEQFDIFLENCKKILKPSGVMFSYTPSKKSDAFINYEPAKKIDNSTLNGIFRKNSPFYGNYYPFRFMNKNDVENQLLASGFKLRYLEIVGRSYNNATEYFEFIVYEGVKN